jgi:hypothetical protein
MLKVAVMLRQDDKLFVSHSWFPNPFKSLLERPDDFLELPGYIYADLPSAVIPGEGKHLAFDAETAFDLKNFIECAQVMRVTWEKLRNPKFKKVV